MRLILTLLICSTSDIIWDFIHPLFAAADYLNMTVSNKKALATLDTVHKWTKCLLVTDYLLLTLGPGEQGAGRVLEGQRRRGRKREVGDLKGKEAREIGENNVSLFYKGLKG